jgi:hypothetical protein
MRARLPGSHATLRSYCAQVFRHAGIWGRLQKSVRAAEFTFPGDPLPWTLPPCRLRELPAIPSCWRIRRNASARKPPRSSSPVSPTSNCLPRTSATVLSATPSRREHRRRAQGRFRGLGRQATARAAISAYSRKFNLELLEAVLQYKRSGRAFAPDVRARSRSCGPVGRLLKFLVWRDAGCLRRERGRLFLLPSSCRFQPCRLDSLRLLAQGDNAWQSTMWRSSGAVRAVMSLRFARASSA